MYPWQVNRYLTENVNMNHNEEVPDFLGGLGDMLPADVLKKVNELLEQLHRKDKVHQGSPVFIYAPGSQYVDKQINIGETHTPETLPVPPCVGRGKGTGELPDELATDEAMALWRKAQQSGYVNEHYQPLLSRTQAALRTTSLCSRGRRRHSWPTRWPSAWISRRSGRCSRLSGTASICGVIITWLLPERDRSTFRTN